MDVRLGRKPPVDDPRTFQLASFLTSALPPPPIALDLTGAAPAYPIFGNDHLGTCTCAAAAHMIEVWTGRQNKLVMPTDADVIALYNKVNGGVDDGALMLDVLKVWRSDGLAGEKPQAYVQVDHLNHANVQTAMSLFQGLYVGINLPHSAKAETKGGVWGAVTDPPGSWGGHAVSALGFNDTGIYLATWGRLLACTWPFFDRYTEEVWAVLPSEWSGTPGFDMTALQADLAALATP